MGDTRPARSAIGRLRTHPDSSGPRPAAHPMLGAGLLAGGANVVMQLAMPAVGYGVVESRVDDGNAFTRPAKRTRTTLAYLAVAMLGTDRERRAYRRAVTRQHARVRSSPSSPVAYRALDPHLQLWVAACLYRGVEDVYRTFLGDLGPEAAERLYQDCAVLGTTLQVPRALWPADRAAFERYWSRSLERVSIDDTVRDHLDAVVGLRMFPRPVSLLAGPPHRFVTTGFLPPVFRRQMRLPWTPRRQRWFDRLMRVVAAVVRRSPRILREFPYNALLWDVRRRLRKGTPLV